MGFPILATCQGSYDNNIVIKPMTDNTIQISGNPTKWLQGHNLFGTNDLKWLMYRFYTDLHEKLCDDGLNPTMQQYEQVEQETIPFQGLI